MLDFDFGKYAFYVWVSYGLSALVIGVLVAGALRHAARWKRRAEELNWDRR